MAWAHHFYWEYLLCNTGRNPSSLRRRFDYFQLFLLPPAGFRGNEGAGWGYNELLFEIQINSWKKKLASSWFKVFKNVKLSYQLSRGSKKYSFRNFGYGSEYIGSQEAALQSYQIDELEFDCHQLDHTTHPEDIPNLEREIAGFKLVVYSTHK